MSARAAYAVLALAAFAAGCMAPLIPAAPFARYFGPVPTPVAMALVAAAGLAALARLERVGWTPGAIATPRRHAALAGLGALCALPTVGLDVALPFPADINAPLPAALVFYPAIGVVAESVFHLASFALASLLVPGRPLLGILAGAAVEPVFQVAAGGGLDTRNAVMAALLFGFGLVQMTALGRHGFTAAFGLRLGYYATWHILWGSARLPLLFGA